MFERFTEEARQIVVLAQQEARETFRHNYIGTEHLLLGLLREEANVAAQALGGLGVTLEDARARISRIVEPGEEATVGQIPFTPRAKKVLELALREALGLGHNYIGPEHILLGLVRENEGVAARVLGEFGAEAERVRDEVIRVLSGPGYRPRRPSPRVVVGPAHRTIETAWLGDLEHLIDQLSVEIRHELKRDPDVGDLLLLLASARNTLSSRALAELGVDLEALQAAVERIRRERADFEGESMVEIRRRLGLPPGP